MLFSTVSLVASLVSYVLASPQIVITRTNTQIVVVTPKPSVTSTVFVTVTKTSTLTSTSKKPTSTSKSSTGGVVTVTQTITVKPTTTSKPLTTSSIPCPAPLYYQCGGDNWDGCKKCRDKTATCYSQNPWYWQCIDRTSVPEPTEEAKA